MSITNFDPENPDSFGFARDYRQLSFNGEYYTNQDTCKTVSELDYVRLYTSIIKFLRSRSNNDLDTRKIARNLIRRQFESYCNPRAKPIANVIHLIKSLKPVIPTTLITFPINYFFDAGRSVKRFCELSGIEELEILSSGPNNIDDPKSKSKEWILNLYDTYINGILNKPNIDYIKLIDSYESAGSFFIKSGVFSSAFDMVWNARLCELIRIKISGESSNVKITGYCCDFCNEKLEKTFGLDEAIKSMPIPVPRWNEEPDENDEYIPTGCREDKCGLRWEAIPDPNPETAEIEAYGKQIMERSKLRGKLYTEAYKEAFQTLKQRTGLKDNEVYELPEFLKLTDELNTKKLAEAGI